MRLVRLLLAIRIYLAIVMLIGALAAPERSYAQQAQPLVGFERVDGLSHNTVLSILQDKRGFLWVGTVDGLNRYDGYSFTVYRHDPRDSTSLSDNTIRALAEDGQGRLWIGTGNGVNRLNRRTGSFERYLEREKKSLVDVHRLLVDECGILEMSTYRQTYYRFDSTMNRFRQRTAPGTFIADDTISVASLSEALTIYESIETRGGTRWIGTSNGVFRAESSGGHLQHYALDTTGSAKLSNVVLDLYEDQAGTIWAGTRSGLFRYDPHEKPFIHLKPGTGLPRHSGAGTVMDIEEDTVGNFWAGTHGGGLLRIDPITRFVQTFHHSTEGDKIWSLQYDRNGTLWLGTDNGLLSFNLISAQFTRHSLPTSHPHSTAVYAIIRGNNKRLWIAAAWDIFLFDTVSRQVIKRVSPNSPIQLGTIQALCLDAHGILWIGTENTGLMRYDPERNVLKRYPYATADSTGLAGGTVWAIYEDDGYKLWLGTDLGLTRFDRHSELFFSYSAAEYLPGPIVYSILEDEKGRLWMGTHQGLERFNPETGEFRKFDLNDSIGSREFNRRAALRTRNDTLVFGGLKGLTFFDPSTIRDNPYIPPLVVTGISKSNRQGTSSLSPVQASTDGLVLNWDDYVFSFEFVALSFTDAEENRYAYRLEGFDEEWVEARTRRTARYTNVPPGTYSFRVKGSNNDGIWNNKGAAIQLTILPPFWQTWWFRLAVLGAVISLLTAAHRYRVAQVRRVERMRLRIASDLHDDIGSKLSSIALLSDMMQDRAKLPAEERAELTRIGEAARHLVDGLREIVWFVDPKHDAHVALLDKMQTTAAALIGDTDYVFEAPEQAPPVSDVQLRRNVFLIYKEALHNIARHACADVVHITVYRLGESFVLTITDDGVGFDPDAPTNGHGLKNMQLRAERIGARLEISSRRSAGTTLRLRVNIT